MQIFRFCLFLAAAAVQVVSCRQGVLPDRVNYEALPAITDKGIHVVVEAPAGTNRMVEYRDGAFHPSGKEEVAEAVRFLPFPGNLGFIPSTAQAAGGGAGLDVLLVCESLPTGTVTEALPIGALRLESGGAEEVKIIAVPLDSMVRVIPVTAFRDFLIQYDAAKHIIEEWFLSYRGTGSTRLLGWEDERYAMDEIRKHARSNE